MIKCCLNTTLPNDAETKDDFRDWARPLFDSGRIEVKEAASYSVFYFLDESDLITMKLKFAGRIEIADVPPMWGNLMEIENALTNYVNGMANTSTESK